VLTNITPLAVEGAEALACLQVKPDSYDVACRICSGISEITVRCAAVLILNVQLPVVAVVGP
jgi:hypothetical protein